MTAPRAQPRSDTGILADSQEAADLRHDLHVAGLNLVSVVEALRARASDLDPVTISADLITDARAAVARATAALDAFERAGTKKMESA